MVEGMQERHGELVKEVRNTLKHALTNEKNAHVSKTVAEWHMAMVKSWKEQCVKQFNMKLFNHHFCPRSSFVMMH